MRLVVIVAAALALTASAFAATPVKATLTTSSAKPVVDQPWRYTITVKSSTGKPLAAKVRLQILVGTTVVGCWKNGQMAECLDGSLGSWIRFKGKRTGLLTFPERSVGVTLTFRAIVVAANRTIKLRAPVTVQPVP